MMCFLGSLGSNALDAKAAEYLAGALKSNATLRELKCAAHS